MFHTLEYHSKPLRILRNLVNLEGSLHYGWVLFAGAVAGGCVVVAVVEYDPGDPGDPGVWGSLFLFLLRMFHRVGVGTAAAVDIEGHTAAAGIVDYYVQQHTEVRTAEVHIA